MCFAERFARVARPRNGGSPRTTGGAVAACLVLTTATASGQAPLQIGGFNGDRGGDLSAQSGAWIAGLRVDIRNAFPDAEFSGAGTLTDDYLETVDVVLLSAVYAAARVPIDPLTADEQSALRRFVEDGGTALLFADNTDFAAAGQSLMAPFGIVVDGWLNTSSEAWVIDPNRHAVTRGPFGTVQSMLVGAPGEFLDTGPYAVGFAEVRVNSVSHVVAAVIEPGDLEPMSGLVVALSDTSMLFDQFRSADTTALVLNALDIALAPICRVDVNEDGFVDTRDVLQFLGSWVLRDPAADWNQDGTVDTRDFLAYLNEWTAGC